MAPYPLNNQMVKLQRHKAYTYETDKGQKIEHYKHLVVIPEDKLHALGWNEGDDLDSVVKGNALVFKRKSEHNE
jgi:hypothetical protein